MRILIVSYNWPPRNAMGTHRVLGWANSWAEKGEDVTVLTACNQAFDMPLDLRADIDPRIQVIAVQYVSLFRRLFYSAAKLSLFRRLLRALNKGVRGDSNPWGSPRDKWFEGAVSAIAFKKEFDIIISTFGPPVCHRVGAKIKEHNPQAFWVADYRDLWLGNPNVSLNEKQCDQILREEREVLSKADLITTVSGGFAAKLSMIHEGRNITVSSNGHDFSRSELQKLFAGESAVPRSDKLSIVYTGNHYPDTQDPLPIFEAIRLLCEKKAKRENVSVDFFGERLSEIAPAALSCGVSDCVKVHSHISRREALHKQREASLLLLLEGQGDAGGVIPGKLYEYMCSGTPILCVGPESDSPIGKLLAQTGTGVALGVSVDRIESYLEDALSGSALCGFKPNIDCVMSLSRKELASDLLSKIKRQMN